jgi:phenylacetate-CoA ligase
MLLELYHRLPAPLKSLAASARGVHLRSWRYGADTEQLVSEALDRERWTPERWQTWQQEQLTALLACAASQVPFYREYWAGRGTAWERLDNWPILEKESLRAQPRAFIADGCDPRKMFHDHTSGTTGKPLHLWLARSTVQAWYALAELRWRRWYGVSRQDRWAILGGQLIVPVARRRPPFWVWNAAFRQLYLSAYHLAPDLIPHYLDALRRYQVTYLLGYTSALYELAMEVTRRGVRDLKMRVVITNAEPVFDYQRAAIAAAFQCPVRETYGMAEIVAAASECEAGRLHLWPEAGHVEAVDGELICTGLLNTDMPLIRYRVGDRGRLAAAGTTCACGRTLPVLEAVEGRLDDVLYTTDGRVIGRLDPVFKADLPVREAQVIQESLTRVIVRYVPTVGFSAAHDQSIIERLQQRLGPIQVKLEPVTELPRTANGKFRAVISHVRSR